MSYPINYPTPQGANIQIFKEGGTTSNWVKPQGASFVWFTLIGSGGWGGYGSTLAGGGGGGSGAVTNFMGPAFLMPDVLQVYVSQSKDPGAPSGSDAVFDNTTIIYQQKNGTGYTLLTGNGGGNGSSTGPGGAAGAASVNNYFSAMGFFQSIAGQAGASNPGSTTAGVDVSASTTTFLGGGASGSGANPGTGGKTTPNYGYPSLQNTPTGGTTRGDPGYFQMQPIIVGCGGAGGSTTTTGTGSAGGNGGIGCGGGGAGEDASSIITKNKGGNGMVVIITW